MPLRFPAHAACLRHSNMSMLHGPCAWSNTSIVVFASGRLMCTHSVTSGTRPLVTGWLDVMRLSHPKHLVVAEDVSAGKPAPECYRLGRHRLDLSPNVERGNCLVIEDSPAGVVAGKAAGCQVIGLATTHSIEQLVDSGADWIVQDLRSVVLVGLDSNGSIQMEVRNALQLRC